MLVDFFFSEGLCLQATATVSGADAAAGSDDEGSDDGPPRKRRGGHTGGFEIGLSGFGFLCFNYF